MRWIVASIVLFVSGAMANAVDELREGVGSAPNATLSMQYQRTFLRVDVAEVKALLSEKTAAAIAPHAANEDLSGESRAQIEAELIGAESVLVTMAFVRNVGLDRFLDGTRKSIEGAVKTGVVSKAELAAMWPTIANDWSVIEARGIKQGDTVYYRCDGDKIRTVCIASDGEVILDVLRIGPDRTRAVKGSFFSRESDFGNKLIESLVK